MYNIPYKVNISNIYTYRSVPNNLHYPITLIVYLYSLTTDQELTYRSLFLIS